MIEDFTLLKNFFGNEREMLEASFDSYPLQYGQTVPLAVSQNPLHVTLRVNNNSLYTLIMYDMSVPGRSPFLHFLEVNIPGSRIDYGNTLVLYERPSPPPGSGDHTYFVNLYSQNSRIPPFQVNSRANFPIVDFVTHYDLYNLAQVAFTVPAPELNAPQYSYQQPMAMMADGVADKESWVANLSDEDQKYCRCILEGAAREPDACITEKAWYQEREGHTCANPYAFCHYTIPAAGGRPICGPNYVWENIPYKYVREYALMNHIPIPATENKDQLIQNIRQRKVAELRV